MQIRSVFTVIGLTLLAGLPLACRGSNDAGEPSAETSPYWSPDDVLSGAIVVDFTDGTTKAQYDAYESDWGIDVEFNSIEGEDDGITVSRGALPEDLDALLAKIRSNPHVELAEPLLEYDALSSSFLGSALLWVPNDPRYSEQWNLRMINMEQAWDKATGRGVVVAVIDTGVAYHDHDAFIVVPDLKDAKFAKGYDFVNDSDHPHDDNGHGTHVAGTIAQVTNNKEGVAGIAFNAKIMPIKVLSRFGSGNSADIADAIRWAADEGADVINLSLGGGSRSRVMENAVRYAIKKDVVVVAAAGNANRGVVEYPAAYDGVIAVSAVGPSGDRAPYSSWGEQIDVAAPGGDKKRGEDSGVLQNTLVRGKISEAEYAYYQGTSMATPHVAGVAALLKSAGVEKPEQIEKIIEKSAKDKGKDGWDAVYGHGILDAAAALNTAGGTYKTSAAIPRGIITTIIIWILTWIFRRRRGFEGVNILTPQFLIAAVLASVGFFFLKWFGSGIMDLVAQPLAEWPRWALGAARPSPIAYSAIVPLLLAFVAVPFKRGRLFIAGLAAGVAGFLLWALIGGTDLAWIASGTVERIWLAVNVFVAIFSSWILLRVAYGPKSN